MNTNKMNAMTAVMNNRDLTQIIFEFAFAPVSKCCDKCQVPRYALPPLRLLKTPLVSHKYLHPNLPLTSIGNPCSLSEIPADIKNNENIMVDVYIETKYSEKNEWLCNMCFCNRLTTMFEKLQLQNTTCAITETIQEEHPDWDTKKINTEMKKEMKKIIGNEYLFQTHRLKKTQEKSKKYEELIYSNLRHNFSRERTIQKEKTQEKKEEVTECIQKYKMNICAHNSRYWVREIRTRKISKWYVDRKIPEKFYMLITSQMYNHYTFPTWEKFAERYDRHAQVGNQEAQRYTDPIKRKQHTFPALPNWWYEL